MNRSPLSAWRRLFAAGGAPAATHAVLSRAPAPERLLEPMARVRMAAETSLDALARPIDLAGVLSRVLEGMSVAPSNGSDEGEAPVRTRSGAAPVVDAIKPVSRARQIGNTLPGAPAVRSGPRVPPPSRKHVATNQSPRVDDALRIGPPAAPHEHPLNLLDAKKTVSARTTVPFAHRSTSLDTQAGAQARVLVEAPVRGIDRLLAIGDPAAGAARSGRSMARTNGPAMEPSASDAARALASAVDRVASRRLTSPAASPRGEPRWHAPEHNEMLIAEHDRTAVNGGPRATESVTAIVNTAPSNGGFRGLARRTLVANDGQQHIPVRLEPEARTPSDVPLDTLDARVAESLARILEREARRHGVDLAESRG